MLLHTLCCSAAISMTSISGLSCLGTNSASSCLTAAQHPYSVQLQQHGCTTPKDRIPVLVFFCCAAVRQELTELTAELVSMLTILCDALTICIGIKLCTYKSRSENSVRSPNNTKSHMGVHACRPELCLHTCKNKSLIARIYQA